MNSIIDIPLGNSPARARAHVALYRLAAAALGHPLPELHDAIVDGRFHHAFSEAWYAVTGRRWPKSAPSPDFATLEAGYIDIFLHGQRGEPRVHLLAGDYEVLRGGVTRPVFMLNIQAFYQHFDLQAATADEGRSEEPDHIVAMLEFMAVLHHLEAEALQRGRDPSAYRRAQRDFLQRCLLPLAEMVHRSVATERRAQLDGTLLRLIQDLPQRLVQQLADLEARVGPCADQTQRAPDRPQHLAQNLWS